MAVAKDELLRMTVEITIAAVGGAIERPMPLAGVEPSAPAFMQSVYEKLDELNERR